MIASNHEEEFPHLLTCVAAALQNKLPLRDTRFQFRPGYEKTRLKSFVIFPSLSKQVLRHCLQTVVECFFKIAAHSSFIFLIIFILRSTQNNLCNWNCVIKHINNSISCASWDVYTSSSVFICQRCTVLSSSCTDFKENSCTKQVYVSTPVVRATDCYLHSKTCLHIWYLLKHI